MFKEDDKEVKAIISRVFSYLSKVAYDDLTQSIKGSSEVFGELTENLTKTLSILEKIPLEDVK